MSMEKLERSPCGRLVSIGQGLKAFVPDPLPRQIDLSRSAIYRLDEASRAVAMLAGVGETIPNPHLLIRPFMRREAVLSSRIEGTQASLSDLLVYEASGLPRGDVIEVANYIAALELGLELLEKLPLCVRLVNQVHARLLRGARGDNRGAGALRTQQVWIGEAGTDIGSARFIPPPANMVRDLMLDWEKFVNDPLEMPPLVQCALMHYQIEAIHPYPDGNGRIGRLLNVLFLCTKRVLPTPLLYLSAYFERDRDQYYDQLFNVSASGDWERWVLYFLDGVTEQARDALLRVRRIRQLQERYRRLLQEERESGNALRLVEELFVSPVITIPRAASLLGLTRAGARRIFERLSSIGIIEELPGHWPRLFVARELLEAIEMPKAPELPGRPESAQS